jgi:hypothetical protein
MSRDAHRPSAKRPLLRDPRARRALVQVGGDVTVVGDAALGARLADALRVRAGEDDATLTHPFHAYPARLHPATARALVAALDLPAGATLLDPFCGSGTVLVEAMAAGLRAVGRDLSPLAVALAEVKTWVSTAAQRREVVRMAYITADRAREQVRAGLRAEAPAGEARWYHPHTLAELAALTALLRDVHGETGDALRMLLSSVLVKVSLQRADSVLERAEKDVPPGAALHRYAYKSKELERCLAALAEAVPAGAARDVAEDDATRLDTLPAGRVDGVVTSPPYANTYDYADHHARRYAWLGLDDAAMRAGELGAARWFRDPAAGARRFAEELAAHCAALARVMRPGATALVVLGDGAARSLELRADVALAAAAATAGLTVRAAASQPRAAYDEESRRAFARAPRREHVIALTKPGASPTKPGSTP